MKKVLVICLILFLSSCFMFSRTIGYMSENSTYNISINQRYLFVTKDREDKVISIADNRINNIISQAFARNGWQIVKQKQMANYILEWKYIEQSFTQTMYLPQYGDTSISSINTRTSGYGDYSGSSYRFGNSINSYGDFNYAENSYTDVQYNQGIVGYVPVNYLQYGSGLGFQIVEQKTNQAVYSFALAVTDYTIINKNDIGAYVYWVLVHNFDGTYGNVQRLNCDIDKQKRVKCSKAWL